MKKTWSFLCTLAMVLSLFSSHIAAVHAETSGNSTQSFANLVLFVQFSDTAGDFMDAKQEYGDDTYTQAAVHDYTDSTYPKSLVSYMDTISYGQFHVNTYMPQLNNGKITPIKLSHARSYYDDWSMIESAQSEAITIAKNTYNGLASYNLDQVSDNIVDNVTFIFAGAEDARGNAFYAHKNNYAGDDQINGKSIGAVNVLMADTIFKDDMSSTGEIAHEFMHSIGYPDLYHEDDGTPVGSWDLMAQASLYNQWPLAYMRSAVSHWLTINTITASQQLTLVPQSQKNGNQAYILKTPISDSEFFVVEFRKQGERYTDQLDVKIPGSGLIIYRVNTRVEYLSNRFGTDAVYVFRPGETSVTSDAGDMSSSFLSSESKRTSYGSSDMTAKITDGALVYSDGQNSGITISNVGSAEGDTISFNVNFTDTSNIGLWGTLGDGPVVSSSNGGLLSMAVDSTSSYPGVLVPDSSSSLSLYEYDGSSWQALPAKITDFGSDAALAYYNGVPYVLYSDTSSVLKLSMYKRSAQTWQTKQVASNSSSHVALYASGGLLYLAWNEGKQSFTSPVYKNCVEQYNGSEFLNLQTFTDGYYSIIHFCTSAGSVYYSTFDVDNNNHPIVRKIEGNTSQDLPVPSSGSNNVLIAGDDTDLYLFNAWEKDTGKSYLYKYSADRKTLIKQDGELSEKNSGVSALTLYKGIPLVQVEDNAGEYNPTTGTAVYRYENHQWWKEGMTLSPEIANSTDIAMIGDTCFVGLMDSSDSNVPTIRTKKITVQSSSSSPATLSSLIVNPVKTSYTIGESFNASDIAVNGIYTNMERKVLAYGTEADQYSISGFDTSTAGTKTVTVGCGNAEDTYQITVTASGTSIPVSSITLTPSPLSLKTGKSSAITAEVMPVNASNKNLSWSSANESVATVSSSGLVTAHKAGTATITAAAQDGSNVISTCTVTVEDPYVYVSSIVLNRNYQDLKTGGGFNLTASVYPSNASNRSISWSSSNSSIAQVNTNGYVTAVRAGTAVIYASANDGSRITSSCTVSVSDPVILVSNVSLDQSSLALTVGNTTVLSASISPSNANNRSISWSSSNTGVAQVDSQGRVSAVGTGNAVIYASAIDGSNQSASCSIIVRSRLEGFVYSLYKTTLDREPDTNGMAYWMWQLSSGQRTGSSVVESFVFGQEFTNKNYCNEHFARHLYRAIFSREADDNGLAYWLDQMAHGRSRESVLNGFLGGAEFSGMCSAAGIAVGSGITEPAHGTIQVWPCPEDGRLDSGISSFVLRMYTKCLGRSAEFGGASYWADRLNSHSTTGTDVATSFFFSSEFLSHGFDNEEYVRRLYRTILNREGESGGVAYWVSLLRRGASRQAVLQGFANSNEWAGICARYGIPR